MDFEILYQELANGALIIPALLSGLSPKEAALKPSPQSWSMLEVLCHLYDEECEDFRQRLDIILHRPQDPWPPINPQGWVTERGYNQRDFDEMQKRWLAERERSLSWLRSQAGADWESVSTSPFGSMKAGDMLASWVAHDNLHIRQLVELRRARIENITKPFTIGYAGDW